MLRRAATIALRHQAPVALTPTAAQLPMHVGASSTSACALATSAVRLFSSTSIVRQTKRDSNADEAELVEVLATKPRHVARRVRQMLVGTNRKLSQFRNTVTFLMIVLQTKLQRGEITPEDAAVVLEGVLQESVALNQSDMAHLLFRAALRFRKFGVRMSVNSVRLLFTSYKGSDGKDMMKQLAIEMSDPQQVKELRPLAVAAYMFAGMVDEAAALRQSVPAKELTTEDYTALVEGYVHTQQWDAFGAIINEALGRDEDGVDAGAVLSSAIVALTSNSTLQLNVYRGAFEHKLTLSPKAIAAVVRSRLRGVKTVESVGEVEATMKKELGIQDLGLPAQTAIITSSSDFLARSLNQGDGVMLAKVKQLRMVLENAIENDEGNDIESNYVTSLIRGYGVLGETTEMVSCLKWLREKVPVAVDHWAFLEAIRWHAHHGNVRGVLDLKQTMEQDGIYHHPRLYTHLFKALDRYYPKLTEQYYQELRRKLAQLDAFTYGTVLRAFIVIRRHDVVADIAAEMQARSERGDDVYTDHNVGLLLSAWRNDTPQFDRMVQLANKKQFLSSAQTQMRVIDGYTAQKRYKELEAFVDALPYKAPAVYSSLLRAASERRDMPKFKSIIEELKTNGIEFTDTIFFGIASGCMKFRGSPEVREIVASARSLVTAKTCRYYGSAAMMLSRLGDLEGVQDLWHKMVDSGMSISMETFNRFLEIHVHENNVASMQEVLRVMMERVPPNPVTTTTVVDMLGKMGRLAEMEVLIDEMANSQTVQPTLVTYHHAMHAYARTGDVLKMEAMRARMRRSGFVENKVTFNILFDGYGRAKRYEHLPELLREREGLKIPMDDQGYCVILGMYAKGRMADEVNGVVNDMLSRPAGNAGGLTPRMLGSIAEAYSYIRDLENVERYVKQLLAHPDVTQNSVETVFLIYHRLRDVERLDALLKKHLSTASEFIFNICVGAFAKTQNHERVAELLSEMQRRDLALSTNTAIIVSSLLLKAGKVELAQTVLKWKTRKSTSLQRSEGEEEAAKPKGKGRKSPALADPVVEVGSDATALDEE